MQACVPRERESMPRPLDLPDFASPPVDEVVVGVQFLPLGGFHDALVGLYWQSLRQDYPRVEPQPRLVDIPIQMTLERQPGPIPIPLPFPIGIAPQGRTWLVSHNDKFLIQIQNTRFLQNWRKRAGQYPHFEQVHTLFRDHYQQFLRLLDQENVVRPDVQQIEVSYINWIRDLSMEAFLKPATASSIVLQNSALQPVNQTWTGRYSLGTEDGITRVLNVQCQPAFRMVEGGNRPGIQFVFTVNAARANGMGTEELESVMFDSREAIVRAFDQLTTDQAHRHWGKIG